ADPAHWRTVRRTRLLVGVGAGALALLAVGVLGTVALVGRPARVAAAASTVRVQRGTVRTTVSAAGNVQPVQVRGLGFSTAGVVTEVDVRPGDTVAPGQVLARIDDTSVQDEVNAAQAGVNAAVDALDRAQQTAPATPAAPACAAGRVHAAALAEPGDPDPSPSTSDSPSPSASASASAPAGPPPPPPPARPPAGAGGAQQRTSPTCAAAAGTGAGSAGGTG